MDCKVADFSGNWRMKSSENFEELLRALAELIRSPNSPEEGPEGNTKVCTAGMDVENIGVNVFLRKIAVAAASRPSVQIKQEGETLSIQTFTSVRTTNVSFTVGQTFSETTVDGRPCTSYPKWETDRKITCEQTLIKGEGPKTSWTRELTSDGELILTMCAGDVVCTRVYERE